jgi:exodeoxyribonuclease VII small subunit
MAKREQTKGGEPPPANFEAQLASLERIVRELERGDLPLERSLELFEQGVRLSRDCQERLNEAERRIEVLLRDGEGRTSAVAFERDEFAAEVDAEEAEEDESVF